MNKPISFIIYSLPQVNKQMTKKNQSNNIWRDYGQCYYDFMYENFIDWPVTSLQWGNMLSSNQQYFSQRLYFSCRTDGFYNNNDNLWQNTPNYIVLSTVEIPSPGHYFINELKSLFNHDSVKKHPNMKIKQIITHPGQVTVIRTSPVNKKVLASKSDNNQIYLWTSDRYKVNNNGSYANTPDMILSATKSQRPNYALRFSPSLMRLISASGNKIQLFDLENSGPTKRELGSMISSNSIKPLLSLQGHDFVEDLAFKNNQVWISGGQDKQIGVWDYRTKYMTHKIKDIHTHDINCLSIRDNIILSGGEEGLVNIIDDRTYKVLYSKTFQKPVRSISFNPNTRDFGIGSDQLSIYSMDKIEQSQQIQKIFTHHGIKSSINQFDWNLQSPMTMAATCQQQLSEQHTHGGIIHFFKPSDIFFDKKEEILDKIKRGYMKLTSEERQKIDEYL